MASFLNGAAMMACAASAHILPVSGGESGDRLFSCLAAAFWIFAINYAALGILTLADERRAYAFALRLVGFVAILIGILLKDRELVEHLRPRGTDEVNY